MNIQFNIKYDHISLIKHPLLKMKKLCKFLLVVSNLYITCIVNYFDYTFAELYDTIH